MKFTHKLILPLCAALCLSLLSACGEEGVVAASSASASSAASATSSAPSTSSKPASSSAGTSSQPASSSAPAASLKTVNVTVQTSDEKAAVLVMQIPENWNFNGYTTFTREDMKIAEVVAAWKITDAANPFSEEMTGHFSHPELADGPQYPAGYGLVDTQDRNVGGSLTRTYLYKTMPDDLAKEWYPHYIFHVIDDYVLQIHCYSFDKTADSATFDTVIDSAKLSFA